METLILTHLPAVISGVLLVVLILMVVTNIIVEVLKKQTWDKVPTNILATLVAMVLTVAAFFAAAEIVALTVKWYMVGGAVVKGFFVAFAAMHGFDKFRQTLDQLRGLKEKL